MTADDDRVDAIVVKLLAAGREVTQRRPAPKPPFDFAVALAPYEQLLAGRLEETIGLDTLLAAVQRHGRLVLHAEAGAGKTTLAMRAMLRSIDHGRPAILLDLRRWTPMLDTRLRELIGEDVQRMAVLLAEVAEPPVDEPALRQVARRHGALLVVDGLNELPSGSSNPLLAVLDAFATRNPQAAVLVTDRLVRRTLPSDRWATAGIADVSAPDVTVGGLPDNALLLDLALRQQTQTTTTTSAVLKHFLRDVAELDFDEYETLAGIALELYREHSGRTFELHELLRPELEGAVERLVSADVLRVDGEAAYFRHHLFHDHLAAHAVVRDPQTWSDDSVLDALTFKANAFDAVALALEQIADPDAADRFVIAVYDWNLYAAAYALARGRRLGSVAVTSGTELAILGMLAERRWDPIAATVEKVEDALRLFPEGLASRLLAAVDPDEVSTIVAEQEVHGAHAVAWREVFLGERDDDVDALLSHLRGDDPLLGWTAANVLRRQQRRRALDERLHDVLEHGPHKVRWRAAHVLGARPKSRNVKALLRRLDDDDSHWVRYGAIRALVEIAAADDDLRATVLRRLRERLGRLRTDYVVLDELERSLVLRQPPRGWADDVAPLVEDLWAMSDSLFDQDHWRRVGWRVTRAAHAA